MAGRAIYRSDLDIYGSDLFISDSQLGVEKGGATHSNILGWIGVKSAGDMAASEEVCVQFLHYTLLTNLLSNHEQFISNIIILGSYWCNKTHKVFQL